MKTVAIYERLEGERAKHGEWLRLGTFRLRIKHDSIRAISEEFIYLHPNADPAALYIARRTRLAGLVADDAERIPFDCGVYRVRWDNGHDCGDLPGTYRSYKLAEQAGKEWKRDMVSGEPTEKERRAAREAYQWEVVEDEVED